MCRRFITLTLEELEDLIYGIPFDDHEEYRDSWLNRPTKTKALDAYPKASVPLIVLGEDGLEAKEMHWGFAASWTKDILFNTRIEKALGSKNNLWRASLDNRRCIVPSWGFYEPHQSETCPSPKTGKAIAQQYLFVPADGTLLFMAGIYDEGCFSLVTTEPNRSVKPIHNRMPIVLRRAELLPWLERAPAETFAVERPGLSASRA